jgi:hypothetical protein
MSEILHHGKSSREFIPLYMGTDYFYFWHEPCKEKANMGHCKIYAVLIDNSCRIIFNLQCDDCKKTDAIKVAPFMGSIFNPYHIFHLSPNLKDRIGKHSWDDD